MQLLEKLTQDFIDKAENASSLAQLMQVKSEFLGKKSVISSQFKEILKLDLQERITQGKKINDIQSEIKKKFIYYKDRLKSRLQLSSDQLNKKIDLTIPHKDFTIGKIHPISQTIELLYEIFISKGFEVKTGPEIENEWYNFTALNMDENHPARKMHDTFYLKGRNSFLLRTHTSNAQIRNMEKLKPPIKFISIGKTFRSDQDRTHTPMFHQIEGLLIGQTINFSHLKFLIKEFLMKFFNNIDIKIRFRPSYFPFTEPSCEVDIKLSEKKPWIEILGCGMVHPKVLHNVNIDSTIYQGFAFGAGIERITMVKHHIDDLREFFAGDIKWIEYFGMSPFKLNKNFSFQ